MSEPRLSRGTVCLAFSRGRCAEGTNCPYPHVESGPSAPTGVRPQGQERRLCRYHALPGGCKHGARCRFRHDDAGTPTVGPRVRETSQPPSQHAESGLQSELRTWLRFVPQSPPPVGLGRRRLQELFESALKLVSGGDANVRQQLIARLASDGGLARIKELIDRHVGNCTDDESDALFVELLSPFLRTISHQDVLSSMLLEKPVDDIYTFLFGPSGRRAIPLFRFVSTAVAATVSGSSLDAAIVHVGAALAVLRQIVDLNGTALIIQDFHPAVQTIAECLGSDGPTEDASLSIRRAFQDLSRIQNRLHLGSSMGQVPTNRRQEPQTVASFEILQDLPGSLSVEGPRHDNDHEDITQIKVMPTPEEIRSHRPEYLPIRDPATWHHPGVRGLLDRQFRLLREDTVGPLRDAVRFEMERLRKSSTNVLSSTVANHGARTISYANIQLQSLKFEPRKGLRVLAELDQPTPLRRMTKNQRSEWWNNTNHLRHDSLLCLADSEGGLVFMSVADRVVRSTASETAVAGSQAADKPSPPCDLVGDSHRAMIVLGLVDLDRLGVVQIIDHLTKSWAARRILVEFPGVLLPSFQPTLQVLQERSFSYELPFAEFLAPSPDAIANNRIPPPAYARAPGFTFDLSCLLTNDERLTLSTREIFDFDMLRRGSTLDDAQGVALVNALTRSLAMIQGPPGTGKSFTGVALIRVLLASRISPALGPIICVCYTNHALDQLLEHLVHGGTKQIVRIGSRSKSALIGPLNLWTISQKSHKTSLEKRTEWEIWSQLKPASEEISALLSKLDNTEHWKTIKDYLEVHHPQHHDELFRREEENGFQTVLSEPSRIISRWLTSGGRNRERAQVRPVAVLLEASGVYEMISAERRALYRYWRDGILNSVREHIWLALKSYKRSKDRLNQCRQEVNLRCLQEASVIGVTTTGLARHIELLQRVKAKVVLCEEAGEVLEAHTLTALLPGVEQLILIGDHQQLRPHIQNYELQHDHPRGEQYALDVSLFERLVSPNASWATGLSFDTLNVQRRMHPSIAKLVRDTQYPSLQDHHSVLDYPDVYGMARRLFWLDHQHLEAHRDSTLSTSHSNDFEIDMAAALVSHLIRQGKYESGDIAVITPYLGQLHKLRSRMAMSHEVIVGDRDAEDLIKIGLEDETKTPPSSSAPLRTTLLKALRLATVDNFQGEEAKVIVISLVRSNAEKKCGFLKTANRINVLLSRAQYGMFIIGNAGTSAHVPMWAEVLDIMERNGNMGQALPLRCERHPDTTIKVSTPDDFLLLAPEGGCNKRCNLRLDCGHSCINRCHSNMLHNAVTCLEPCRRSKAGCDHPCPRPCGMDCEKRCHHIVVNVGLPCGHVRPRLECYREQDISQVRCDVPMERQVRGCGHTVKAPCHKNVDAEGFECDATCGELLPCGHNCLRKCRECNTRIENRVVERRHGPCQHQCGRPYNTCSHECRSTCHGEKPCPLCDAPCQVQCAHSKCDKKCQEPCAPCAEQCVWSCPHRGKCEMPCAVPCDILPCSARCGENLSCGHRCPSICGEKCPTSGFCQTCAPEEVKKTVVDFILGDTFADIEVDNDPVIVPSCGHLLTVSSMDGHMGMSDHYDVSVDGAVTSRRPLAETAQLEKLKRCPLCRGSLRDINRYSRIVRQALLHESTKKFVTWANRQFVPLEQGLFDEERRLGESLEAEATAFCSRVEHRAGPEFLAPEPMTVDQSSDSQVAKIGSLSGLDNRHQPILRLRGSIATYLKQVGDEEQPFGRVFDMVQDIRRRQGITADLSVDRTVLNTRNRLLASSLAIRCDLAIVSDFVAFRQQGRRVAKHPAWMRADVQLDHSQNRQACEDLLHEATLRQQPMLEVEAHLYFVRWVILERDGSIRNPSTALEHTKQLLDAASTHLSAAKSTCEAKPGSTRGMRPEVDALETALQQASVNASTFYAAVANDERRQVFAAMALEFSGTGHWYTCSNGHLFTIGECGGPMQTSTCPQCGAVIGGEHHQTADGVQRADAFEREFAALAVG